jgi:hypothetical protein
MAPPGRSYGEVGEFFAPGWRSGLVLRALTFGERWRGLRPRPHAGGLWLAGRSVHGFGMKESLWVCGLDEEEVVIAVRYLQPARLATIPRAKSVLELSFRLRPPVVGMALTWLDARDVDSVRDADRQPG